MLNQDKVDILKLYPATAVCPVFGRCGGCQYQDITYAAELKLKQKYLEDLFIEQGMTVKTFETIIASPIDYHYRSRLDMKFLKTKDGQMFMGFSPREGKWMIEVNACPIAMPAISDFLPELKKGAIAKLPPKYRNANLVVKVGDDGRIAWGGIGKHSLKMKPEDFLWTEIEDKKIFYSLDTFFQANLAILPSLMRKIREFNILNNKTIFYDLYGGVGLFGICMADDVAKVILIEDNIHSVNMAKHNAAVHSFNHFEIIAGRVEDIYPQFLIQDRTASSVAMIDPPRQGLALSVAQAIAEAKRVNHLLYLSCHPESLMRDLQIFITKGWKIETVVPFDFFPRTQHIETLVHLQP